jgi:hypothetical protein
MALLGVSGVLNHQFYSRVGKTNKKLWRFVSFSFAVIMRQAVRISFWGCEGEIWVSLDWHCVCLD